MNEELAQYTFSNALGGDVGIHYNNRVKDRLDRLERVVLSVTALISGEAQSAGTQEEVDALKIALVADLADITSELRS